MNLYYATCAAGLERVAAEVAKKTIPKFTLRELLAGAVVYEAKPGTLGGVFSNTYLLLGRLPGAKDVEQAAQLFLSDKRRMREVNDKLASLGFDSVRVMFSNGNVLTSVDQKLRIAFEKQLSAARIDRVRPSTELLILRRTDGAAYMLLRLSKGGAEKKAAKGELSPGVAMCMAHLARPTPDGVLLDPFAGAGALGKARAAIGSAGKILLYDNDAKKVGAMRAAFRPPLYEVGLYDALTLEDVLERGSVSELATDPPWGLFEPLPMPAAEYYQRMLKSFAYALKEGGHMAVLTADKDAFARALRAENAFELNDRIDVLVNGKKAAIFSAEKVNS